MEDLTTGDVVTLVSGGPSMTLVSNGGKWSKCQWFDKSDLVHANDFLTETLIKVKGKSK